ncbi:phosphotransferase [Marinomonas ostreistagni]|uniref:phosphotransferase n=1 Tax=Marinomonas ostreistagni TaxID=359209 RepID=UPI00194EA596|nr:phosphotransferase [Marinomonas ostreistagni]MBM6552388.1 phosphotransferase [Marinomonas ostreistagni]
MIAPELFIKRALRATKVTRMEQVQALWSGYGEIARYQIQGAAPAQVILKAISWSHIPPHPRGWQSTHSHQRKIRSYQVEALWYQHWAQRCPDDARVPRLLAVHEDTDITYLLLEDLDQSGYANRHVQLDVSQALTVLHWLACFHSTFLRTPPHNDDWPQGLWQQGTYWHLATRPDEWQAMAPSPLKESAHGLDQALRACPYQTLVHGDAKVANFCFSDDDQQVAAVDFQYVGGGVGVQDVAYFLGSCLTESQLTTHLDYLLEAYFSELSRCLVASGESPDLAESVANAWQDLFAVAWADFHRFILGWSPQHKKNTPFSQALAQQGLAALGN